MKRTWSVVAALLLCGCGVSRSEYDAKSREADLAKQQADAARQQPSQLQQQLGADEQQINDLKDALGMAQSQAITDDQKSHLEESKRPFHQAQQRGKMLENLQ